MKFERILWIRQKNHPETYRPLLVGIRENKMHWDAGLTRCPWEPDKFNILKEYSSDELEKAWDELEEEYAPKPQKPCARLGWVSPEGHFYRSRKSTKIYKFEFQSLSIPLAAVRLRTLVLMD